MATKGYNFGESGSRRKAAAMRNFSRLEPTRGGPQGPGQGPGLPAQSSGKCAPEEAESELGRPLSLRDVAAMLGTSPWSVRQTWIPKGLPCVRTGARGQF